MSESNLLLPWHPATHIRTREDAIAYLDVALEEGTPQVITAVLADIVRSGVIDESLESIPITLWARTEVPSENPAFNLRSALQIINALDLRLAVRFNDSLTDEPR